MSGDYLGKRARFDLGNWTESICCLDNGMKGGMSWRKLRRHTDTQVSPECANLLVARLVQGLCKIAVDTRRIPRKLCLSRYLLDSRL